MKKENGRIESVYKKDISILKNNPKEFWKNVKEIQNAAFYRISNLKQIRIPSEIKSIGKFAFAESNLRKIELEDGLETIENMAFSNCKFLKNIVIPSSVKKISTDAFFNSGIEKIVLSENIETIHKQAFCGCKKLKEIVIPSTLKKINKNAFTDSSLVKIKLNEGLEEIGESAFRRCKIKQIEMPSKIKKIENSLFEDSTLQEIKLNEGLEIIGTSAFFGSKLKNIELPSTLKKIESFAFAGNKKIKKVYLNEGLQQVESNAFAQCKNIEEISIPQGVEILDYAFPLKKNYKKIFLYDIEKMVDKLWFKTFSLSKNTQFYINDETKQYLLSNSSQNIPKGFRKYVELDEYVKELNCDKLSAAILTKNNYLLQNIQDKHLKTANIVYLVETNNINKIKNIFNTKEYNLMLKRIEKKDFYYGSEKKDFLNNLFKFAYNLGAFEEDDKIRQKACNFIENLFDKNLLNSSLVVSLFERMNLDGYNSNWTSFVMNKENCKKIFELESSQLDFMAKTYNEFNEIREFSTSNRGSQRYRKVTVNACVEYFARTIFNSVDEDTMDIPSIIGAYTRSEKSFKRAKIIRREYLKLREEGKINDHILKEELKEKDIYESIEQIKEKIINNSSETLNSLNELANKKFTYEFLSKYDARNFALGKYCSCCAHLEGYGYGIMKASILHPLCQNLVIKDKTGRIIAKSTLYVNKEQRYALFNNVEVNSEITEEEKKLIYNKYKKAINDFVKRYNELNKENLLEQVNVGFHSNDLENEIKREEKSKILLKGIDFSEYGVDNFTYSGDWQHEQYVMWRKK